MEIRYSRDVCDVKIHETQWPPRIQRAAQAFTFPTWSDIENSHRNNELFDSKSDCPMLQICSQLLSKTNAPENTLRYSNRDNIMILGGKLLRSEKQRHLKCLTSDILSI
jgi:hypothetical protein